MSTEQRRPNGFYWVLKGSLTWGFKEWVVAQWFNYTEREEGDNNCWTVPNNENFYNDGDFVKIIEEPIPEPKD